MNGIAEKKTTLVLERKVDESIMIGGGLIEVHIYRVRGGRVRVAVKAPIDVPVHRREVWERIDRSGR